MVAAGAGMHDAMRVANHAAGIVVGKLGTAVVHREELEEDLKKS
jgi:bifunctional ADP-heptose synthase (sugar kinase/adenylyltransferase)